MKIGLIDVDGHNFPNLALMRISAYHKARGDSVEWWWGWGHYDVVYMSKVFSNDYSPDVPEPLNADKIIKGGTGYAISLVDGKEVYDKSKDGMLSPEIERMFPDYSIYPQYDFAVCLTSRGCPRGCPWCHVAPKEGRCAAVKVADVSDFWNGQKKIEVLDPNITSCRDKRDLMRQYRETGAWINFNQGLDIRLTDDDDIEDLNNMKIKRLHFAWDNPAEDLRDYFHNFAEKYQKKDSQRKVVYVLTNFGETMEQNLYRIYTLRELGFDPDVRVYDKPHAPQEIKDLQRWCNNRVIYKSCPRFEDYKPNRKR